MNSLLGTACDRENSEAMILERYRRRYRTQDAVVSGFNFFLGMMLPRRLAQDPPPVPRRILLANAGHLGDAVMSTALFPVIERAFPGASIGFLTGGHSRATIEGHPSIGRAHYLDHWLNSRTQQPRLNGAADYYARKLPAMVRELREADYDAAIDLHGWMPSFVPLLWRAQIPVRVGFSRVGFAPLLTHAFEYTYDRRHEIDHFLDLLRPWRLPTETLALAQPLLSPVTADSRDHVNRLLGLDGAYQVLHPASSTPTRDWTLDGWSSLAARIVDGGSTPVITGAGPRDQAMADQICLGVPHARNAVNKLTWPQLMALLSGADCVYSVETSVGHAAAALGRPVVAIYGGMADPRHWSPRGSAVVTTSLPCSPCFNKHGCAHRSCLVLTTVQDVEAANKEPSPMASRALEMPATQGAAIFPHLEPLTLLRDRLTRWLIEDALPLWARDGVDWESGGYFETLSFDASRRVLKAAGDVRRGRVVARQIFVFDAARRLGWRSAGRDPVTHGCTYLFTRMHDKEGLFHSAVDAKTGQPRLPFSLYEYAFYLYAMARVHGSLAEPFPLAETAVASLQQLRRTWGRANGGFEESDPPSLPLKSNPHMHLLEAALAWIEALDESQQSPWIQLAQEMVNLCLERFIDSHTGALREYFDDAWRPLAGAEGRLVEPGHQFEWAWLLMQWARLRLCDAHQHQLCHRAAERLVELAERWGVDPIRGVAINEIWDDMSPKDPSAKLWPQTERIKAWCSMLEQARTDTAADHASRALTASIRGLIKYFLAEPAGLWEEELRADGTFTPGPCKASSFYHIVSAVQTVDRTLTDLQNPAGPVKDFIFLASERVGV